MANYENLVRQRGGVKSQMTRFSNSLSSINGQTLTINTYSELEARIDNFSKLWDSFNSIQDQIEGLVEDVSTQERERDEFETQYYQLLGSARSLLKQYDSQRQSIPSTNETNATKNVTLPTINLPQFDGSYDKWYNFRDTFKSIIHSNKAINDIQKFHYLRMSLKNEAAHVIQSLETSELNYNIAWDLLNKRFENKRLIIYNHIHALFNLKVISRESYTALRELLDNMLKHLRALENLDQPVKSWDALIVYLISSKLDVSSKREWESSVANKTNETPSLDSFVTFLTHRCHLLETLRPNNYHQAVKAPANKTNSLTLIERVGKCSFCNSDHFITQCNAIMKLPINERISEVKKRQLCLNCLRKGHLMNNCKSRSSCRQCNKRHHTLIHIEPQQNVSPDSNSPRQNTAELSIVNHAVSRQSSQILLSTACVFIKGLNGSWIRCRALLDNGSQSNFITSNLCNKLNLSCTRIQSKVLGINQAAINLTHKTDLLLRSLDNAFEIELDCLIISKITERLPTLSFDPSLLNIPSNIKLADPTFNQEGSIDILLGVNVFWNLLCVGQIKLGTNQPILHKTKLGWVVSGPLPLQLNRNNNLICNLSVNLEKQVEKFWLLENCSSINSNSCDQDVDCETHFIDTVRRDNISGKFVVSIPFTSDKCNLGSSRQLAVKRFYSMERRLNRDSELRTEYIKFMNEYESLGHMKLVKETSVDERAYFFPHHPVIKASSTTTKTRIVFDGSAPTTTGLSLNDAQLAGPVIQNDLFTVLLRFRRHCYALTADIEKMYRQILINESDRKYHRILWRSNPFDDVQCYELQTLTYGTSSAPFLATRCLKQLAIDFASQYPSICDIINNDFYVDDLITGAESIRDINEIKNKLILILSSAGFNLRKWTGNLQHSSKNSDDLNLVKLGDDSETKTLGILWSPVLDIFKYEIMSLQEQRHVSKRNILSITAKLFDPLGLLGPIIVVAKLIIQQLWQCQLSWDESVPQDLYHQWTKYLNQLPSLVNISIPRYVLQQNAQLIQCHGFADASERAFGACIYLRSINTSGDITVNLLCAKSRVAPLRQVTLPRLELCAAVLLARLFRRVKDISSIHFNSHYFWSDSTIVLHWINSHPSRWQTFVSNRVAEIQNYTDSQEWFHVSSSDNPADLVSRGAEPAFLTNSSLWWHGPNWLSSKDFTHPNQFLSTNNEKIPEARKQVTLSTQLVQNDIFCKFSSLTKLQRVVAWCLRFTSNCQTTLTNRHFGPLTVKELQLALICLIKIAQKECFSLEIRALKEGNYNAFKGNLLTLNPFLDNDNIMRVGGRIKQSDFRFDKKHPIILPKNHLLTELVITHEHLRLLHCGPRGVLYSLRQRYWPISGTCLTKKIVRRCITCFKTNPQQPQHLMGNLPSYRISPQPAFYNCGIDYAGPFLLKEKKYRNTKFIKGYICLFICLTTKAIHLELVSDLTTQAFLATLRRFISRRGKPGNIYSDNATNFIGAMRELKEIYRFLSNNDTQQCILDSTSREGITWHFIPPRSPHFGGLWEAGIKSAKSHLKRVVGNNSLCFEDFYTLLTQIEAILNSRPLSPLSDDPSDLNPLTPGHFLIGKPVTCIPETNLLEVNENRLSHYQHLQRMSQHFWTRWSKEYITELQTRSKWSKHSTELIHSGSLVLIRENNQPPLKWKLGRVQELHPGQDGIVRVVTVKTADSVTKRAVKQLCLLPLPNA